MIAVRIEGRLGNQLFQYAFIYAASRKLNSRFYLDKSIEKLLLPKYFDIKEDPLYLLDNYLFRIRGYKNIFTFHLRSLTYNLIRSAFNLKPITVLVDKNDQNVQYTDSAIYFGYFQSETYFAGHENEIRTKFEIKKSWKIDFDKKYSVLYQKKIVTVHIRRTDYLTWNIGGMDLNDPSLPLEYYNSAIARVIDEDVHFVFVSDDPEYVKMNFSWVKNKTISSDNEIMDFQHLINADICIIANSTFSWWGAWLNKNPDKTIYVPRYFLGWKINKEFPKNIYPKNWIQIDF